MILRGFAILILREMWTVVCLLVFGLTFPSAHGFNVDVPTVLTHHGPPGSMFGFSVAQHRDSNVSWILVGAPTADSRQPGVTRAGAVFRCSCLTNEPCQQVIFDRTGNNEVDGRQIDEKSGQWFGATVRSSGDDGIILACAPRYTWFSTNKKRRDPVGTCFIAKDSFTEFVEYSPCRTVRWGYHRQGSCQLGLGADLDAAGRRSFLGAVGSWYWQGQVFVVDSRKSDSGKSENRVPFYQFVPPGQVYSQSTASRPDIRWTKEGPSWDDDSYLGYSVVAGEFNGDQDSDVAVGMPRGANLTGKVVIYSSELTNLYNVTGEQVGAYFGYSLCVLDTDGDGLDDIVIGAPMFTDYNDAAMRIETGRVYVVYQNTGKKKFKKWDYIDGTTNLGRFGLSLCSLGDINRDTYFDFAVGAPYDGPNGRGAVYIYQGTKDGVKREYTQVIYGSALQTGVTTFGFSLSGGKDLDGNGYPDLLVGAYDSNSVSYFRARPVVQVRNKLTFTSGKLVSLDKKDCRLRDGTLVACLPLRLCMSYDGFGVDDVIDFNVQTILDSKKVKEPRMFFRDREGVHILNTTMRLSKATPQCKDTQVYILPQIRDKLTSFEADLRYSMIESRSRRQLPPIVDFTASVTEKDTLSIQKNCGPDNVCIPDLRLRVTPSVKSFVMGSTEKIWIEVEAYNNGDDSFESTLYAQVPPGLTYSYVERTDGPKDIVPCIPPTPATNNTLKCEIGNPLPSFQKIQFRIYFKPRYGSDVKSSYDFAIVINSTNPEHTRNRFDNYKAISMPIRIETKVEVFGFSRPQPIHYNPKLYKVEGKAINESDIGPDVTHSYEIKCGGPSNIDEASVVILWPSFTADDKHFLYMLEQPTLEGPIRCDEVDQVNSLSLKIHGDTRLISSTTISDGEGRRGSGNYSHYQEQSFNGGTYTRNYTNHSRTETTSSRKTSGSSSGTFSGDNNFSSGGGGSYYSGSTRNTARETSLSRSKRGAYEKELECDEGFKCTKIHCRIGPLTTNANTNVFIHVRGRVYAETLKSDKFRGKNVTVKSKLVSRVTTLPYNVDPSFLAYKKVEIVTKIEEEPDLTVPSPIPWWIYVLAIIAGILLLALLIFLLYKCGFFKRRRPNTTPEGQPLHRNGYRD